MNLPQAIKYYQNNVSKEVEENDETKIKIPVFNGNNWIELKDEIMHYFCNANGVRGVPLDYVTLFDNGYQDNGVNTKPSQIFILLTISKI